MAPTKVNPTLHRVPRQEKNTRLTFVLPPASMHRHFHLMARVWRLTSSAGDLCEEQVNSKPKARPVTIIPAPYVLAVVLADPSIYTTSDRWLMPLARSMLRQDSYTHSCPLDRVSQFEILVAVYALERPSPQSMTFCMIPSRSKDPKYTPSFFASPSRQQRTGILLAASHGPAEERHRPFFLDILSVIAVAHPITYG